MRFAATCILTYVACVLAVGVVSCVASFVQGGDWGLGGAATHAGFFIAGGIAIIIALLWAGYIFARKAVSGR